MGKLKVMTIVGTRPEIIKLSRVMAELDRYTDHVIVHTGQNFDYELNEIFSRSSMYASPTIIWMQPEKMRQRLSPMSYRRVMH